MRSKGDEVVPERLLLERLREEDLRSLYIIYGQERYLVRKARDILEQRVLTLGGTREFSVFRYAYGDVGIDEILDCARMVPIFGTTRLITLVNADDIKEKDAERLKAYIENPSPSTCLLLACGAALPHKELFRFLRARHADSCVGFPRLKRPSLVYWIKEIAGERGIRVTSSLMEQLIETAGSDLDAISNQIEKIALFGGGGGRQHDEGIPLLLHTTREEPFYLLTDCIVRGNRIEALKSLNRMVEQGEPPLLILSRLSWEIRRMWAIRDAVLKGASEESACEEAGVKKFKIQSYLPVARNYTENRIKSHIRRILQTDRALKSSRLDPRVHLERLVWDLCEPFDTNASS